MNYHQEVEKFLKKHHEEGYTIVFSGCVGAVKAMGAAIPFWEILEPHSRYINSIRTSSGSGIPLSLAASGMPIKEVGRRIPTFKFRDFIEDIGLFAEHNSGEHFWNHLNNVAAYYISSYLAAKTIVRHLTSGVGIIKGDRLKDLLKNNLRTNNFCDTYPNLEVVATKLGEGTPFVFSKETTPYISISDAVTASCAITELVTPQLIDETQYVDAAASEPLPQCSIVDSHIKRGANPEKLLIIGFFVHTFPGREPERDKQHVFAMKKHYATLSHRNNFQRDRQILDHQKIKHIIIELNSLNVNVPIHDPFPELKELGLGFRRIRKLAAKAFRKDELERLLRGVTIFLYEEMNTEHLPYYLNAFRPVIEEKFIKKIRSFEE